MAHSSRSAVEIGLVTDYVIKPTSALLRDMEEDLRGRSDTFRRGAQHGLRQLREFLLAEERGTPDASYLRRRAPVDQDGVHDWTSGTRDRWWCIKCGAFAEGNGSCLLPRKKAGCLGEHAVGGLLARMDCLAYDLWSQDAHSEMGAEWHAGLRYVHVQLGAAVEIARVRIQFYPTQEPYE